jgi:hypothetical protein
MRFKSRLLLADDWSDMVPGAEKSSPKPNVVPAPQADEPWYHGRRGEINFDPSRPAFFTREREGANWYAHERGARQDDPTVGVFKLSIQHPARVRDLMQAVEELGVTEEDVAANSAYGGENYVDYLYVPEVREHLESKGFDGYTGWDVLDQGDIQIAVPFNVTQIQSSK